MEGVECDSPVEDKELEERIKRSMGIEVPIIRCERFLWRGNDVTDLVNGFFNPRDGRIYLGPNATEETLKHELAHYLLYKEKPEIYERYYTAPKEERLNIRAEIEKETKRLEEKVKIRELLK